MKVSIRKNTLKKGFSYTVYIDYGIVNGHRKKEPLETFSTIKQAENYKSKVQTEINENTFTSIPNISFSEAIDKWFNNYVINNCEPNTADSYKTINEKYLKPCLGHIPFKIISSPQGIDIINNYYKYLRFELQNETYQLKNGTIKNKNNLSYSSVEKHKAQISGVFSYFMKNKALTTNICFNTEVPKTNEEKQKDTIIDNIDDFEDDEILEDDEFITPEQAVQLLNQFMNTDIMVPVFLAAFLGLRRSEIGGILNGKVDIENCKIIIKNVRVRCGNKTIFKKRTKNKTSTRIIYLPKLMIDILKLDEKRKERNKRLYGDEYIESKLLCVKDDGSPFSLNDISKKFKRVFDNFCKKELEKNPNFIFPKVTLHTLRHLNISALLANGAVLTDVQANAGHSDIKTTIHYTHTYNVGKKSIADKTDEIYRPLLKKMG